MQHLFVDHCRGGITLIIVLYPGRHSTNVSPITALIPIGLKYTFCFTTDVANGPSLKDYIQHYLMSEALVETIEDTHHTNSSTFCTLECATTMCSRLSSQGQPDSLGKQARPKSERVWAKI
ncbi:hypothetical protein J1N35_003741 [Gossypium stocksii]|uniref:Uncharacterized protein n=1 Tax=Gossypium stocksii TaxID=47602 RepID=A0A9D3WAD4_9ROSI|nr:hypothetical protein J1N35_003741 [Gossypium stocksii]